MLWRTAVTCWTVDFKALSLIYQPCLRLNDICFTLLIQNGRDWWKGCKTEKGYLEVEYAYFDSLSLLDES